MIVKKVNTIGAIGKISLIGLMKTWFFLGIFFLPFVFWPWAKIPYEIPKVWFFQRWVEGLGVLGVLGVLGGETGKEGKKGEMFLVLGVLGFVLVAVVSSLLGMDLRKSVWGNYYRADGLLTLIHLAGLFFFPNLFWEKSWREPLVKNFAASSMILSFWTIFLGLRLGILGGLGGLGRFGGSTFGREIGATFGNPNFLAGYLLVTLSFTISKLGRLGVLGKLGIAGQVGAILLTGSRAGILGVLGLGAVLVWRKSGKQGRLGILWLLGAVGILGGLWGLRTAGEKEFVAESRERIWRKGFSAFLEKPIFGWGWANFDYAFESMDYPIKLNQDVYVDKAHSSFLEVLVATGIIGLFGQIELIGAGLRGLLKNVKGLLKDDKELLKDFKEEDLNWRRTLLFAFLLFLFHSQTNVISVNEEMFFWLILGIVSAETIV